MKVRELIKILQDMPPDQDVFIRSHPDFETGIDYVQLYAAPMEIPVRFMPKIAEPRIIITSDKWSRS